MAYEIETIEPHQAAKAYGAIKDPSGKANPESLARAGQSFAFTSPGGAATFTLEKIGRELWIVAAAGKDSHDLTKIGFELVEGMAKGAGADSIGFQTARPGLVRKAKKHGYSVAGWILKKAV